MVKAKWFVGPLAAILLLLLWIAYEDWSRRSDGRERGFEACVEAGHTEKACEEGIDRHDDRCFNLCYHTEKGVPGTLILRDYVECVILGPDGHKRKHLERLEERKKRRNPPLRGM